MCDILKSMDRTNAPAILADLALTKIPSSKAVPCDPVNIAQALYGISVVEAILPPEVSSALVKQPKESVVIVIPKNDNKFEKRFSCARQIGRYICIRRNPSGEEDSYAYISGRDALEECESPNDCFSIEFAEHLLMPHKEAERLCKKGKSIEEIGRFFGVPTRAVVHHFSRIGLYDAPFPCKTAENTYSATA